MKMKRFEGKVVLITGASAGIGEALAYRFGEEGASLCLCARREERLLNVVKEVEAKGGQAIALRCDVTVDGEMERAVEEAKKRFQKIDIVVANAGFGVAGFIEKLKIEDFRRQFETNVFGVLRTFYATFEELKKNKGQFVVLGSVAGYIPSPGSAPYSMSKFAIRAFAETLRAEMKPYGISVVLISPGFVESDIRRTDNFGRVHENKKDPVPSWLVMPREKAAKIIVDAIHAKKPEEVVTLHGKALVFASKHLWRTTRFFLQRGFRLRKDLH